MSSQHAGCSRVELFPTARSPSVREQQLAAASQITTPTFFGSVSCGVRPMRPLRHSGTGRDPVRGSPRNVS